MKCKILHDLPGRMRVHLCCGQMSLSQADVLEYYLRAGQGIRDVKVYDRTCDAVVVYDGVRESVISALASFSFAKAESTVSVPEHTSRALNREFEDKLAFTVMCRCVSKLFLPLPVASVLAVIRSVKYIKEGLSALWHGKNTLSAVLAADMLAPRKLRLNFVKLFRRNYRLMAVFHIILRHLALIDLPLFCEEIDREAFLRNNYGVDTI